MANLNPDLADGLRRIKRFKIIAVLSVVGFIPAGIVGVLAEESFGTSFLFVVGGYAIAISAVNFILAIGAKCPSCGEWYHRRMSGFGLHNVLARHCLNCGLNLAAQRK